MVVDFYSTEMLLLLQKIINNGPEEHCIGAPTEKSSENAGNSVNVQSKCKLLSSTAAESCDEAKK